MDAATQQVTQGTNSIPASMQTHGLPPAIRESTGIMTPGELTATARSAKKDGRRGELSFLKFVYWRRYVFYLVVLASLVTAVVIFSWTWKEEQKQWQDELRRDCQNRANALGNTFERDRKTMQVVAKVVSLFYMRMATPSLNQTLYKDIARETIAASFSLNTLSFSRYVRHSERAAYETANHMPIVDFLTQKRANNNEDYLVAELVYSPVEFVGIDIMSFPGVRDGVNNVLLLGDYSGGAAVTSGENKMGMQAGIPLFSKDISGNSTMEERRAAFIGVLGTEFQLWKIMDWVQQGAGDLVMKLVDSTTKRMIPLFRPQQEMASRRSWTRRDYASHEKVHMGASARSYELWCRRGGGNSTFPLRGVVWAVAILVAGAVVAQFLWVQVVSYEQSEQEYRNAVKLARELAQARMEVENHSSARSTYLAAVSQEMRAPMNGVLDMLNLLLDTENLTPTQLDYIETALSNGRTLLSIVNDILDFYHNNHGSPSNGQHPLQHSG